MSRNLISNSVVIFRARQCIAPGGRSSVALLCDGACSMNRATSNFQSSLDSMRVGAAFSRLFAASIGDLVVIFSRSPVQKYYSLADIEWTVMPPVSTRQLYVVEAVDRKRGFRAAVAAVVGWLIDAVGDVAGVQSALQWLATDPFKEQNLNQFTISRGVGA
jgi:hypothetical protein